MPNQPVQFLLHQFATNEQNIINFNKSNFFRIKKTGEQLFLYHKNFGGELTPDEFTGGGYLAEAIFGTPVFELLATEFVRTCLSRTKDGKVVLRVFDKKIEVEALYREDGGLYTPTHYNTVDSVLYVIFDRPLSNGHSLDTALAALDDKMLELVPEYVEFCKNLT